MPFSTYVVSFSDRGVSQMNKKTLSKIGSGAGVLALTVGAVALSATPASAGAGGATTLVAEGGILSATLADQMVDFGDVPFSFDNQGVPKSTTLNMVDGTGTDAGWTVTMQASDMTGSIGGNPAIPATNISVTDLSNLTSIGGADTTGVTLTDTSSPLPLDGTQTIANATVGNGAGDYTADITLNVVVPSRAGLPSDTYNGTYTLTMTAL